MKGLGIGAEHAVIVLDRRGAVKHASDTARRWLREYFDTRPRRRTRLPEPLRTWLGRQRRPVAEGRGQPRSQAFSVPREGRRLIVRLIPDRARRFLLLEEHTPTPGPETLQSFRLTPRETEVLAWVAAGKANQDIAAILGISSRTVKKHLEHIYGKLGVETRTAAATFFTLLSSALSVGHPADVRVRPMSAERRLDERIGTRQVRRGERRKRLDIAEGLGGGHQT